MSSHIFDLFLVPHPGPLTSTDRPGTMTRMDGVDPGCLSPLDNPDGLNQLDDLNGLVHSKTIEHPPQKEVHNLSSAKPWLRIWFFVASEYQLRTFSDSRVFLGIFGLFHVKSEGSPDFLIKFSQLIPLILEKVSDTLRAISSGFLRNLSGIL